MTISWSGLCTHHWFCKIIPCQSPRVKNVHVVEINSSRPWIFWTNWNRLEDIGIDATDQTNYRDEVLRGSEIHENQSCIYIVCDCMLLYARFEILQTWTARSPMQIDLSTSRRKAMPVSCRWYVSHDRLCQICPVRIRKVKHIKVVQCSCTHAKSRYCLHILPWFSWKIRIQKFNIMQLLQFSLSRI